MQVAAVGPREDDVPLAALVDADEMSDDVLVLEVSDLLQDGVLLVKVRLVVKLLYCDLQIDRLCLQV